MIREFSRERLLQLGGFSPSEEVFGTHGAVRLGPTMTDVEHTRVLFRKREGDPDLALALTWELVLDGPAESSVTDLFIPELFFDFFFVRSGQVSVTSPSHSAPFLLPEQSLKTLFGRQIVFDFSLPLQLFGARFDLRFAESYWGDDLGGSQFVAAPWVAPETSRLESFAEQVADRVLDNRRASVHRKLLNDDLSETTALAPFSTRHKRRLVHDTYGCSRKEMLSIRNMHGFLTEPCFIENDAPRLVDHVGSDRYHDQPHLNRAFKSRTGMAPLDYLRASSTLQENLMAVSYNESP